MVLPVVAGLIIRQLLERKAPTAAKASLAVFPSISVIVIVVILAAVVGLNAENILTVSAVIFAAVVIHNTIGFASGYTIGYMANMPEDRIRACTFEVGLQNSGLATALAITFFSPLAALLPALFSVWMVIVGPMIATYFARQTDEKERSQSSTDPTMTD